MFKFETKLSSVLVAIIVAAALATAPAAAQTATTSTTTTTTAKPKRPLTPGQIAARERMKKCAAEWKATKAAGKVEKGMKWPQYWSACNKRLKGAAT
ncbi:MAG: hypothetical protein KIT48_22120 [Pseudolabrys sp.]|nr:hypothetical protein [Pseudolabrys sp.]